MSTSARVTRVRPPVLGRLMSFVVLATLVLPLAGCRWDPLGVQNSIDDVVKEVERTRQTIEGESTAWRDELPKLVNSLNGMESTIAADARGILADTTNQLQDLSTQTLQMTDAKAQDLIAQAGVEFRCNAGFVKAGVVAQLNSIVEDLQFWKQNKSHLNKKPPHAVCWINPTALSLYQSGSNWLIDTSNMADKNIVKVFGYSFWPSALPTLELQNAGGQKLRNVNLTAAYVTHYQINLDFSNEKFPDAVPGARLVFRWPDQADPNTINLTLKSQAKLKFSNPVFNPTRPTAGKDAVTLQVTVKNEGGTRSGNFVVAWKPDPNDNCHAIGEPAASGGGPVQAGVYPTVYLSAERLAPVGRLPEQRRRHPALHGDRAASANAHGGAAQQQVQDRRDHRRPVPGRHRCHGLHHSLWCIRRTATRPSWTRPGTKDFLSEWIDSLWILFRQ